jgi:ABC-2 type transport system ATP-binding protein
VFFSSHIIADIEVLCDRVAILSRGRLTHLGRLDELREGGDVAGHLEVTVVGAPLDALEDALRKVDGARVTATPAGARIDVPSELDVDDALAAARGCGARLVSVQPVRQSLEDLFVGGGPRALHAD